jgi:hypothetical protein
MRRCAEKRACLPAAQGIEAVSFFAEGKKDTSVKPGPAARRQDAPELKRKIFVTPDWAGRPLPSFCLRSYSVYENSCCAD